jgi:exopolyphosphatase/guanosine-5'-triphosphate,3'-diphosphate pyrophosphatase
MRGDRLNAASTRRAAIDIGTVTTRLLIADVADGRVSEVVRRTVVTHLGEGLHATGAMSPGAIGRVRDAVEGFASEIAEHRAEEVFADASNGRSLLSELDAAGVHPRIIAGDTEARLSFLGATSEMEGDGILIADLGGGSTELVFGSAHVRDGERVVDVAAARSLDVGSRRVLDMFLHSDPPTPTELAAAAAWAAEEMRPFFDSIRERTQTLVTLAGTGTTLSAVRQRLAVYDPARVHGSCLTGGDVADLREDLAALPLPARREVVGMDPARAEVIVAGAVILESILALSGVDSTVVSEHDILYGLVLAGI